MRTSHQSHIIFSRFQACRFLLSCAVIKQSRTLFRILIWNKWKAGFRIQKEGLNYSVLAETRGLATSNTERTCVPEKLPKFVGKQKQKHANKENKAKELKKVFSSILLHTHSHKKPLLSQENMIFPYKRDVSLTIGINTSRNVFIWSTRRVKTIGEKRFGGFEKLCAPLENS